MTAVNTLDTIIQAKSPRIIATSAIISGSTTTITSPKNLNYGNELPTAGVTLTAVTTVFTSPDVVWEYALSTSPTTWNYADIGIVFTRTPAQFLTYVGTATSVLFRCKVSQQGFTPVVSPSYTVTYVKETDDVPIITQSSTNISIPTTSDGLTSTFTDSATTIKVARGGVDLTYGTSGPNTFSVAIASTTAVTVSSGIGSGITYTLPVITAIYASYGVVNLNITIRDSKGQEATVYPRSISYSKTLQGAVGTNKKVLVTYNPGSAFMYNASGFTPIPSSTTITATAPNITNPYFEFIIGSTQKANSTSGTYVYTPTVDYVNMPEQLTVNVREGSAASAIIDTYSSALLASKPGVQGAPGTGLVIDLTRDMFHVATDKNGNGGSYNNANTQTTLKIYNNSTDVTSSWTVSTTLSNASATYNGAACPTTNVSGLSAPVINVTGLSQDSGYVSLIATSGATTLTTVFAGTKVKAGLDGAIPAIYDLIPNSGAINRSSTNVYSTSPIVFTAYIINSGASSIFTGGYYSFYTDTTGSWSAPINTGPANSVSYTPSGSSLKRIKCELYTDAARTNLVDMEVIPITSDGIQGIPGGTGLPGTSASDAGKAHLYQWAPVQPLSPTGTSIYNWATSACTSYTGTNNWSYSLPSNNGNLGNKLWMAEHDVSDLLDAINTSVTWDSTTVITDITYNSEGIAKSGKAEVYQWATSIPSAPTGTSTFFYNTRTISSPPAAPWYTMQMLPTSSPGFTLWKATVDVLGNLTDSSTAVNWVGATVTPVSYASSGTTTFRTAYTAVSLSSLDSLPNIAKAVSPNNNPTLITSGLSSLPPNDSWGRGTVWQASVPTLSSGQNMFQVEGVYDSTTGNIVWGVPYISSVKVGNLSAIAVNTGSLNVTGYMRVPSVYSTSPTTFIGKGYYFGNDGRYFVGNSAGGYMMYDPTTGLTIDGDITASNAKFKGITIKTADGSQTILSAGGDFTGSINSKSAAEVLLGITNGNDAATGTSNYRKNVAPTNNAAFGMLTTGTATTNGDVLVNVPYTYAQGAVPADGLYVFYKEGGGTIVASDPAILTNAVTGSLNFSLKPQTNYTFGVQAVRRTEAGTIGTGILTSGIITTIAANYTGNIAGTSAVTLSNAVITASNKADAASTAASNATIALSDYSNDNKLTGLEKQQTLVEWNSIQSEVTGITSQANMLGVITTDYSTNYTALSGYIIPLLSSLSTTSDIVGSDFRLKFTNYYAARQNILNAITTATKTRADNAATTAGQAVTTANNAASTAGTALAKANEASVAVAAATTAAANASAAAALSTQAINDMSNDNKLTQLEKQQTLVQFNNIYSENNGIWTQGQNLGCTGATAYANAYGALSTYLNPLLANLGTVSDIVGTTFRSYFSNYYTARQTLLDQIAAALKLKADNANTTASNALSTATNALSAANAATTAVSNMNTAIGSKLDNTLGEKVLNGFISANLTSSQTGFRAGSIMWNNLGTWSSGSGVAITPKGIIGHNGTNYTFTLDAQTGAANFKGEVNVGDFTGYAWPAAGGTGVHLSKNGLALGNPNVSAGNPKGRYFLISTPLGGEATLATNIPAYIEDLQIKTIKIGDNQVTVPVAAYNPAFIELHPGYGFGTVNVIQLSTISSGQKAIINFSCISGTTYREVFYFELFRRTYYDLYNYSEISIIKIGAGQTQIAGGPTSFTISDTPPAGNTMYYVIMGGGDYFNCQFRSLTYLEAKK